MKKEIEFTKKLKQYPDIFPDEDFNYDTHFLEKWDASEEKEEIIALIQGYFEERNFSAPLDLLKHLEHSHLIENCEYIMRHLQFIYIVAHTEGEKNPLKGVMKAGVKFMKEHYKIVRRLTGDEQEEPE